MLVFFPVGFMLTLGKWLHLWGRMAVIHYAAGTMTTGFFGKHRLPLRGHRKWKISLPPCPSPLCFTREARLAKERGRGSRTPSSNFSPFFHSFIHSPDTPCSWVPSVCRHRARWGARRWRDRLGRCAHRALGICGCDGGLDSCTLQQG